MTKQKINYVPVKNGQEIFLPLYKRAKVACCDCGLVHNFSFTVYKEGKAIKDPSHKGYRISLRPSRNPKATSILRKERKHVCQK